MQTIRDCLTGPPKPSDNILIFYNQVKLSIICIRHSAYHINLLILTHFSFFCAMDSPPSPLFTFLSVYLAHGLSFSSGFKLERVLSGVGMLPTLRKRPCASFLLAPSSIGCVVCKQRGGEPRRVV